MLLGCIRHGQTDWNLIGKIQGQSNIPLNEVGRMQAHQLANRLGGEAQYQWDYVITSDLSRAVETGDIIAAALSIPLLDPDPRLRERYFGQVEGLTPSEREARWGKEWDKLDLGQEKDEHITARALDLVKDLSDQYGDKNILLISHGALLARLYTYLFQDQCKERIGNLSLTVFDQTEQGWKLQLYNCTRHLEQMLSNPK